MTLTWPVPEQASRFRRRRGTERRDDAASICDLSMTGALVRAPSDPRVVLGSLVSVRLDGVAARVLVRRVSPDDDGYVHYGVEFIEPHHRLRDLLHERVMDGDGPHEPPR